MIDWLAADPVSTATTWKDFLPVGVPLATVSAALIAGRYLTRNSKKTPYEHLDVLIKARSGWPDGLDGRDSVDRSIGHALAQIRVNEGSTAHPAPTAEAREADERVADELRTRTRFDVVILGSLFLAVAPLFVVVVIAWWEGLDQFADDPVAGVLNYIAVGAAGLLPIVSAAKVVEAVRWLKRDNAERSRRVPVRLTMTSRSSGATTRRTRKSGPARRRRARAA